VRRVFGGRVARGVFGGPTAREGFGGPTAREGFGGPTARGVFGGPTAREGFGGRVVRWVLGGRKSLGAVASVAGVIVAAIVLAIPTDGGEAGAALGLDSSSHVGGTSTTSAGQAFNGLAAVGALFAYSGGKLGAHFCTASVVHSRGGDLAVTAAHCVTGDAAQIVFIPGYANGKSPYGVWRVTQVYTDQAWKSSQDPDDDVAFLRLSKASDGVPIEDVTGAERLGSSESAGTLVQVVGYPDGENEPVWCVNWTKSFSPTQLQFDCDGYTDGTSGGPFLSDVSSVSGEGTIIGVIGGYEQGGLTPSVSYASVFGAEVAALYQTAAADG
jgi:V8-like Glu-specific endopeptidase